MTIEFRILRIKSIIRGLELAKPMASGNELRRLEKKIDHWTAALLDLIEAPE
jgi:hypothetical protein